MKIKDVQIDGFGVWSGLHVDSMPDGMTVFYGPNEAGKTTLMQFLRTMFYGFTADRRQRYLPPVHGGRPGGAIRVTGPGGGYEIARRPNMNETGVSGQLTVTSADGMVQGQHRMAMLLGQVDESIFTNVFAIGLRELQELSTLDDTAAADELYKLSSGLDRVSLVDVIRQLRTARTSIVSTGEAGQLQTMMTRREKLRDEIDQLSARGRRWAELAAQRRSQNGEIEELKERSHQWELEARIVETALQVRTPWNQRNELQRQVKELNARTDVQEASADRLRKLAQELEERKQKIAALKEQRLALRQKSRALPVRRSVVELASKIEAAGEQGPWIASLQKQIQRVRSQVEQTKEQLVEDAKRLGMTDADVEALLEDRRLANMPDLSREAIARLTGPAREVRASTVRLRQAKEQGKQDSKETARLQHEISSYLGSREQTDLHEAMASQADLIAKLRKRLALQERLDKLLKTRQELEDEAISLGTEEALPTERAFMLALPFIGGGFLILSGVCRWFGIGFVKDQSTGTIWVLAGFLLMFFWYMWRQLSDRGTETDLDDCEEQLEAVRKQIRRTELERDDFDKLLPAAPGSLEQRLKDAESDLLQLESLLPVYHNHQAASQRQQAARKLATAAAHSLKVARSDWQKTLKALGLTDSLSPKSIRIMAEGYESLLQTRRRLKAQEDELQQREVELSTITQRIDGLVRQVQAAGKRDVPSNTAASPATREGSRTVSADSVDPRAAKGNNPSNQRDHGKDRRDRDRDRDRDRERDRRESQEAKQTVSIRAASLDSPVSTDDSNSPGAVAQIQFLQNLVAEQQHFLIQRKEFREEDLVLSKQQKGVQKSYDRLVRARQALLAELGVESQEQLEQLLNVKQRHEKLLKQIEDIQERLRAIIGGVAPYETIMRQLENPGSDDLEKRWETLLHRVQQAEQRVSQLHQRQGEIIQEMKSLASERRLAEAKLDLVCLEKQIEACAMHWQTLGATTCMLEKVCEVYENERQPETLREASNFLKQLTEGKYVRVWTPLGKNALRIDNQQGQSLPLEVLSRGTREAVFIALRLSLAAAYARRGVMLPLVLDDVLVNFDANRATSAARVLRDFAEMGHQVVMFTCHEHIMRIFFDIGVQVRVLPPQGVAGEARIYEPIALPAAFEPEPIYIEPAYSEPVIAEPIRQEIIEEEIAQLPPPSVVVFPEPIIERPLEVAIAPKPEPVVEKVVEPVIVVESRPVRRIKHRPKLIQPPTLPTIDRYWYQQDPMSDTWIESQEPNAAPADDQESTHWWNPIDLQVVEGNG